MTQLVIFDFDGVLADTEPLSHDNLGTIYASMFLEPKVKAEVERMLLENHGKTHIQMRHQILQELAALGLAEELSEERREETYAAVQGFHHQTLSRKYAREGVPPVANLIKILNELELNGVKVAIGSNSLPDRLRFSINNFVDENGDRIGHKVLDIFGENMFSAPREKQKPNPYVFATALAATGVDGAQAVVVEDSPLGVAAAKDAGVGRVFGFVGLNRTPDIVSQSLLKAGADKVLTSLNELPAAL